MDNTDEIKMFQLSRKSDIWNIKNTVKSKLHVNLLMKTYFELMSH